MARLSHLLTKCTPCTSTEAPIVSSPISSAPLSSEAIPTTSSKLVTSHIGTGENPDEYGESYQFTPKPLQRYRGRIAPRIFTNAPALISTTHLPNIETNPIDVALPSETTKTPKKSSESSSESSSSESHETKPSYAVQEFTKEAVEPESKAEPTKKSDENFIEELPKIGNTVTDPEPAASIAPQLTTTTPAYVTPQATTTTSESIQTSVTSTEQSVEIIPPSTEPTIAQELTTTASSLIAPSVSIDAQIDPNRYPVPPSVARPVGDREFAHVEFSTAAPFQQTRVEIVARELEESFEEETDTNQVVPLAPSLFPIDTNTSPMPIAATATAATSILPTLPPEVTLPRQTTPQLETSASISTQLTLVTVTFPTLLPTAVTTAQGYSERPQQVITARPAPIEPPVFPPGSAPPGPDITDLPALPTTLPPGTSPLPPAPPTTAELLTTTTQEKKPNTYVPQPPVAPPRLPVAPPRISPIPPVAPPVAQRITPNVVVSPSAMPVGKLVSYVPAPVRFEGIVFQTTTRPTVTTTEKKYEEKPSIPVESCKHNFPS